MRLDYFHKDKRGRYQCDLCSHTTWKTLDGVLRHQRAHHEPEIASAEKDKELTELRAKKPEVIYKEKIVYRDAPAPKESDYYYPGVGIYCSTCKLVNRRAGIPVGQTIENTPHNCGNRTVMLVAEIR